MSRRSGSKTIPQHPAPRPTRTGRLPTCSPLTRSTPTSPPCAPASTAASCCPARRPGTPRARPGTSPWTSVPRWSPCPPTRPTSRSSSTFARAQGPADRDAGHGPQRRADGPARRHDARQDLGDARRDDRRGELHRPRRGRRALDRRHRARLRARPRPARRLLARRRRRRLHARRRAELARPPLRPRLQPPAGGRARDRRRRARPLLAARAARAVLGAARRRRLVRRRRRRRVRADPDAHRARRHAACSRGSAPARSCTPGASGRRPCRTASPRPRASSRSRTCPSCRSSCAAAASSSSTARSSSARAARPSCSPRCARSGRRWTRSPTSRRSGLSRIHMDPENPMPGMGDSTMLAELPAEAIDRMVDLAGKGSNSPLTMVELAPPRRRARPLRGRRARALRGRVRVLRDRRARRPGAGRRHRGPPRAAVRRARRPTPTAAST